MMPSPSRFLPRTGLGGGNGEGQGRAKHARTAILVADDDDIIVVEDAPRQAPFLGPAAADTATLRAEATRRLALKPSLKTVDIKARRQAVTEGRTQSGKISVYG